MLPKDMSTEPATTPRRLGSYEIVERIATGGMAEIFLACQRGARGLERLVVVKKILPHLAVQESFVDMFVQEARIVARLNHPNVVQIHDLAEEGTECFIVMEYVPGSTLRQLMDVVEESNVPLPVGVAVNIMAQASRGAHAAHELKDPGGRLLGLVHRDISPHNLMVTPEGSVKLLDFGIAKATEGLEHTSTGTLKGKYSYMSPEQANHQPLDRRSDVFALGIVAWELLTGRRLFKRESELASMQAIVSEDAPRVDTERPDVPKAVADAVAGALQRERDGRTGTAEEFRRALLDAAAELDTRDDAVTGFVTQVLGPQHEARRVHVDAAVEGTLRHTPTLGKMRAASSASSSPSRSGTPTLPPPLPPQDEPVTAVERPQSAPILLTSVKPRPAPAPKRPPWLLGAASLLVAAGAFLGLTQWMGPHAPANTGTPYAGAPVYVGFPPVMDAEVQSRELEPLRLHLERTFERPVKFPNAGTYEEVAEKVLDGTWQFASFPPYLYIRTHRRDARVVPVAFKLFEGASGTDGVLLIREGVVANSIRDTAGKVFCFTDPGSLTGYMLPRVALKKAGLDPNTAAARHVFSGDHLSVMRDLLAGKCDVGATFSGAYMTATQAGVNAGKLRMLTVTGRSPQDAVCAGPAALPAEVDTIRKALLAFDPKLHSDGAILGAVHRITGFVAGGDEQYTTLRTDLQSAGMLR